MNTRTYRAAAGALLGALALAACGQSGSASTPTAIPATATVIATREATAPTATARPAAVPTAAPRPTLAPTAIPEPSGVMLSQVNSYVAASGNVIVFGLVGNYTNAPVGEVKLSISAKSAAGKTVLKDLWSGDPVETAEFAPVLPVIGAGESVPFMYEIYQGEGTDKFSYEVTVESYGDGVVESLPVAIENLHVHTDDRGYSFMLGEVANITDAPVLVDDMYGAALSDKGVLAGVQRSTTYGRYLAPAGQPGDRSFLRVDLGEIGMGSFTPAIFVKTVATEAAPDYKITFADSFYTYQDAYGQAHMVGLVTNEDEQPIMVEALGALYAEDGRLLDWSDSSLYLIRLGPGESVPIHFTDFDRMDNSAGAFDAVASFGVTLEARYTSYEAAPGIRLETSGDALDTSDERSWQAGGIIKNSADKALNRIVVIGALEDQSGKIIAVDFATYSGSSDAGVQPGEEVEYSFGIEAEPGTDPAGLTLRTYVYADPRWLCPHGCHVVLYWRQHRRTITTEVTMEIFGSILLVLAVIFFFVSRSQNARATTISVTDTQTAAGLAQIHQRIAGAGMADAFAEQCDISGTVEADQPLTGKLSGKPCVIYDASVKREYEERVKRTNSEGKQEEVTETGSETIEEHSERIPFYVRDATGRVLVDPEHAEIELVDTHSSLKPPPQGKSVGKRRITGIRSSEEALPIGTQVFVHGCAIDRGGQLLIGHNRRQSGQKFIISLRSKEELLKSASGWARNWMVTAAVCGVFGAVLLVAGLLT